MMKKDKGFFEGLLHSIKLFGAVEASRKPKGRPDPYKAAGIAHGLLGDLSLDDTAKLGAILGSQGAFDDD